MTSREADRPQQPELEETVAALPDRSAHEIRRETNPFTDRDWRMLGYAWSGFVLRVLLIVGGIFTVVQYIQAREEQRIERALQLVELWERPDYQSAQKALKTRLDGLNARYAGLLGSDPSEEERQVYHEQVGLAALGEEGGAMPLDEFSDHFDSIVYFLNRVAFCVEGNLCQRDVVDAYFRDFAASFWTYFQGHVQQERQRGAANYAIKIESWLSDPPPPPGPLGMLMR